MKNIKFYIVAFSLSLLAVSCETDDKVVIDVLDGKTSGAILRTRADKGSFDIFRDERTFELTVEEQDEDNGELIDRVDITVQFIDNNKSGVTGDDTVADIAFGTLAASDFTIGERGLPVADFSFTLAEALVALGIPLTEVLPGDRVQIDLELFFTDGRSFSAADAATTVTGGSFFSSPFAYTLTIDDGIAFGKKGVFVKEINIVPGEVVNDYAVTIRIDDKEGGDLLQTLNVYRTFRDLTIGEDGTNLSEAESLIQTFEVSDLVLDIDPDDADDTGVRTLNFVIPIDDLLGPDVTLADLALGDDFQIRYELITADGRIVTTDDPGTEYFDVIPTTRCIQLNSGGNVVAGEYVIQFADSFGDGWDGAKISVNLNGVTTDYTLETGSETEAKITVPEGSTILEMTYVSGNFEEEHSYVILDPNEQKAFVDGPNPNVGVIPFKVCQPEE